jgi:ATP-dependent protease HslVU (ClpYQ) peptidase subunit
MTIIVALHQDGQTWIGADSRCILHGQIMPTTVRKWVLSPLGDRAVTVGGQTRAALLVRRMAWEGIADADRMADAIRTLARSDEWSPGDDQGPKGYANPFLYATPDGVWDIDHTFGTVSITDGRLWARGSGMDYALGADSAMRAIYPLPGPKIRLEAALAAAVENDAGCGGEMFVHRLGENVASSAFSAVDRCSRATA